MTQVIGNATTYVGGSQGIPVPLYGQERRIPKTPSKPTPTGLDWSKHRAPDAAPEGATVQQAKCPTCRSYVLETSIVDSRCHICIQADVDRDALTRPLPETTLDQELKHLEQTNPVVREAASRLNDVIERITHPEDHVQAPSPEVEKRQAGNLWPIVQQLGALRSAARDLAHQVDAIAAAVAELHAPHEPDETGPDEQAPSGPPVPSARRRLTTPVRRAGVTELDAQDERGIIRRYLAGETAVELAAKYECTPKRIRQILDRNGIQRRDDRALHSGGHPRKYDDDTIREVIRLYVDEHLSRNTVAQRLGIPYKTVCTIMMRAGVTARQGQSGRGDGAKSLKAYMAEHGLVSRDVKQWALDQGLVDHIARGLPPQTLVDAYAEAHSIGGGHA